MKYYQMQNKKLNEIHRYSKIKKELIKDGQNENNNNEHREEKTSAA